MKARNIERKLIRTLDKVKTFFTVKGNENTFQTAEQNEILFTTKSSAAPNKIKKSAIRAAINFFAAAQKVTLKELQQFSSFTSALAALLKAALDVRVEKVNGVFHLILDAVKKGLRYVFAGVCRAVKDLEAAAAAGAEYFLMSYYWIRDRKAWKKHIERLGVKLILDSGAFSAWNKGETLDVKAYAAFVKEHADIIHSFFTLDVIGDPEATKANTDYLKSCGLNPVEVYHVQSDMSVLDEMMENAPELIAIGGAAKMKDAEREAAFKKIFAKYPDQNFHFLGGGSSKLLTAFNWFSADSTTWISARKYNKITDEKGQRKAPELSPMECLLHTVNYFLSLQSA